MVRILALMGKVGKVVTVTLAEAVECDCHYFPGVGTLWEAGPLYLIDVQNIEHIIHEEWPNCAETGLAQRLLLVLLKL